MLCPGAWACKATIHTHVTCLPSPVHVLILDLFSHYLSHALPSLRQEICRAFSMALHTSTSLTVVRVQLDARSRSLAAIYIYVTFGHQWPLIKDGPKLDSERSVSRQARLDWVGLRFQKYCVFCLIVDMVR